MAVESQRLAQMYEQLTEREQTLIAELIERLLPDDVATPADLAAIAKSQDEYERGEAVRLEDL